MYRFVDKRQRSGIVNLSQHIAGEFPDIFEPLPRRVRPHVSILPHRTAFNVLAHAGIDDPRSKAHDLLASLEESFRNKRGGKSIPANIETPQTLMDGVAFGIGSLIVAEEIEAAYAALTNATAEGEYRTLIAPPPHLFMGRLKIDDTDPTIDAMLRRMEELRGSYLPASDQIKLGRVSLA